MISTQIKTKFAPADRVDLVVIENQKDVLNQLSHLTPIFDNIQVFLLILNKQRQIIYANDPLQNLFGSNLTCGMRLGEAISCVHSNEESGGCGTSESCSECGAIRAILNSQNTGYDEQECRITQINNNVLDLNVWAKAITLDKNDFTLFSFTDISNEKRRKVLERLFFHDVLNTAGILRNALEIINDGEIDDKKEFLKMTENISNKLIDEIISQRTLTQAEDDELQLRITSFSTKIILEEVLALYNISSEGNNKKIFIASGSDDAVIESDKTILRRILGNLTKNALEACPKNDTVLVGCNEFENEITFYVTNPNYIPKNIQLQIFKRSFSTKGIGRGIGTYSIKLLTEKYLKGSVKFESNEESGTVFMVKFNRTLLE